MGKNPATVELVSEFQKLQDIFRSHWISLKFYKNKPAGLSLRRNTCFCEAIELALTEPVLLKLSAMPCAGAKYVAGNDQKAKTELIADLCSKGFSKKSAENILRQICHFPEKYEYVGFNTDERQPDCAISFMSPEGMATLITIYNAKTGKQLSCEMAGFVSVCGECVAKSMTHDSITISFGSEAAREKSGLSERAVVCVPAKKMKLFADCDRKHN